MTFLIALAALSFELIAWPQNPGPGTKHFACQITERAGANVNLPADGMFQLVLDDRNKTFLRTRSFSDGKTDWNGPWLYAGRADTGYLLEDGSSSFDERSGVYREAVGSSQISAKCELRRL